MSASPYLRRGPLFVSLSLALLILGTIGILAYWHGPRRGLPYHDSFGADKAEEWQSFGGTWEMVQGSMRDDSNERGARLLTGSPYWQDYSIEADVMMLSFSGYASDAGLIVRSSDEEEGVYAYNGYFAALHTIRGLGSSLRLGRVGFGLWAVSSPLKPSIQTSTGYHIKIMVVGCQLAATASLPSAAALTLVSMTDENCLRNGRVGLLASHSGGVWRNVVVQRATQRDFNQMLAQARVQEGSLHAQTARDKSVLVERPANQPEVLPASLNVSAIRNLRLTPGRVTVNGQVILTSPALFVQDSTGGIVVHPSVPQDLKIGDEVEATGDAHSDTGSLVLDHATVRLLWEGTPMPPASVTASQAATGAFAETFIEVEGYLTKKQHAADGTFIFDFDAGPQSFRAILNRDRGDALYNRLESGSLMRVRGVAVLDPGYTQNMIPFAVLLRSTDDMEVVAGPPWWGLGHLVTVGTGLLILVLLANTLYHRVEQWRLRGIAEERERLAYEMHDTLAQSVAGIGFQLEAIRFGIPEELANAHQQLDLASELVRHSHTEARRSVDMLRPQEFESQNLLSALTSCAHRLVAGGSVRVVATSMGEVRPLNLRTADTLYRIGQEALANAVRHAHPNTLSIALAYEKNAVRLSIGDDGAGFVQREEHRSFGVRGMLKRALSISAKLEICGKPGEGTMVSVTALLLPRITLTSWPLFLWKYLKEHTHNVKTSSSPYSHSDSR